MEDSGGDGAAQPKFSYEHLGGVSGVARWLKFSHERPRFIRPVTMHLLRPGLAVTTRMMELHAAFEYYVGMAQQGKKSWAPRGRASGSKAKILARHGGAEFARLVGNSDRWADVFHWMNNRVKHNPVDPDPVDVHWLNESAETLATIVALNYASARKVAAKSLISHHRTERIGREIAAVLSRYPDPLPTNY